jgi:hypothetical protein
MRVHSIRIAVSLFFGACALAACGGNGSNFNNFPNVQCVYPTGTVVALAYPAPGAVGVPDSPGQIVIAASPALPNTWQVVLQVPGGGVGYEALLNTIAPSAVPTPYATPSFASPIYETSGLTSALPSATTVTVLLNNTASNCNSYPAVGSFTTQ